MRCCVCCVSDAALRSAELQPPFSCPSAALQLHGFGDGVSAGLPAHAEDCTPSWTMRCHADSYAAPAVGVTSGLQRASVARRCCAFQVAGARVARAWLTCSCLAAVPQGSTPCPAAQSRGPYVHPCARAMLMHVFSGRSVQRWPRTRRSSDPLQMRPRRLYFQP